MDALESFGARLKALRLERNMSQEEIAQMLGTSKQVISRYETGLRIPKLTVAVNYCTLLGVPLSVLLGDDKKEPAIENDGRPQDELDKAFNERLPHLTREHKLMFLRLMDGYLSSYPDEK